MTEQEIEQLKYVARFLLLTLGFYATPFNYDPKNIVYHPITGQPASGILFDGGRDAERAIELIKQYGMYDSILGAKYVDPPLALRATKDEEK